MRLRRGIPGDFSLLWELEESCFDPGRRSSPSSIRRSLSSAGQEVWVLVEGGRMIAAMILRRHPRILRIYSIAVAADQRGRGLGRCLIDKAVERTRDLKRERLVLEAEEDDRRLVAWYEVLGFHASRRLPDYYTRGRTALRMVRKMED